MARITDCKCLGKVENPTSTNSQEALAEILLMNLTSLEKSEKPHLIHTFVCKTESQFVVKFRDI